MVELRRVAGVQQVSSAFDGFVNVGIIKRVNPALLARFQSAGDRKIVDQPGLRTALEGIGHGHSTAGLQTVAPKASRHFHLVQGQRPDALPIPGIIPATADPPGQQQYKKNSFGRFHVMTFYQYC